MKRCPQCKKTKPLTEFNKDKQKKDGLKPYCKPCHREKSRLDYSLNKEARRKTNREYMRNNPEKRKKWEQAYYSRPQPKARRKYKAAFGHFIRGTKNRFGAIVGCSLEEFKQYIAAQFDEEMSWDNYGEWHIDHIKPLSSFDLLDEDQVKECFHYSNTQPLWGPDNMAKGMRLKWP